MKALIDFGSGRLVVNSVDDGVYVTGGYQDDDKVFIPDNAVRALIKALEEFEEEKREQRLWGV